MKISGNSMTPYILDGDIISYEEELTPKVGNIVLCKANGEIFAHRYLPNKLVKGDNNLYFDWDSSDHNVILGVVTHRTNNEHNDKLPLKIGFGISNYILAQLSQRNRKGHPLRMIFRLNIIFLGWTSRLFRL